MAPAQDDAMERHLAEEVGEGAEAEAQGGGPPAAGGGPRRRVRGRRRGRARRHRRGERRRAAGRGGDEGDGRGVRGRARGGAVRQGGRGHGRHARPGRGRRRRRQGLHGRQQRHHAHRGRRHVTTGRCDAERAAQHRQQRRARPERERGTRGLGAVAGRPRLRLQPREVPGGAGQGRRDVRRDAGREMEAPHGVRGDEQARRGGAAGQEGEPGHGLLPRERECDPRRASVRPGEAEPGRRRDVPGGGVNEQGQGGTPRRRLRRVQAVGRHAEPHARHVHRRGLRKARPAAPGLTDRPADQATARTASSAVSTVTRASMPLYQYTAFTSTYYASIRDCVPCVQSP